jgi:hypothetical protein
MKTLITTEVLTEAEEGPIEAQMTTAREIKDTQLSMCVMASSIIHSSQSHLLPLKLNLR